MRSNTGLTLIEVLLVMAVMVLMAAVAAPILTGTFEAQKLRRAADLVRSDWGRARVQAIRTGQEWAFVYEPSTGRYTIAPYSPYETPQIPATMPAESQGNFDYGDGLLPVGVRFDDAQVRADTRSESLGDSGGGGGSSRPAASTILFYPDGTSQQARLRLVNDRAWYVQLDLRSLTGSATVSEVGSVNDLPQGGNR